MAIELSSLPTIHELHGSGLQLAGEGFNLKKALKQASKIADVAAPILAATNPELAPEIGTAMAVKKVLDGKGLGKGTQKKVKSAAKKALVVADKLVDEFGSAKQKRQAAKAKRVAEIVGAGKPGAALRQRVMAHYS